MTSLLIALLKMNIGKGLITFLKEDKIVKLFLVLILFL